MLNRLVLLIIAATPFLSFLACDDKKTINEPKLVSGKIEIQ